VNALPKLALFDCDGTLVDSQNIIIACMRAGFAADGLAPPDDESIRRIVGLSLPIAVAHLLPPDASEPRRVERIVDAYKSEFTQSRTRPEHHEPLFPGVLETLQTLEEAGWLLGVATGKTRRGLDAVLALHGLSNRFVTLQTADRCRSKPDPEMVHMAVIEAGASVDRASGLTATRTVVIGDTSFDMLMARSAGAKAVGVSWGYHPTDELVAAGAAAIIHSFEALPALASELVGD
jgi:phosphoglycolate phosphatase